MSVKDLPIREITRRENAKMARLGRFELEFLMVSIVAKDMGSILTSAAGNLADVTTSLRPTHRTFGMDGGTEKLSCQDIGAGIFTLHGLSFHSFPKLPIELRIMSWEYTPRPRCFYLQIYGHEVSTTSGLEYENIDEPMTLPIVLQVHKELRYKLFSKYLVLFGNPCEFSSPKACIFSRNGGVRFNTDMDVLVIDDIYDPYTRRTSDSPSYFLRFVMAVSKEDLASLRCIALAFDLCDVLDMPEQPHLKESFARLPSIEPILVELGCKIYWEAHGNLPERTLTKN
ncbi:hypothetical protein BDZ45DRAFT_499221 [Acephala macrosclerotiorum]|nr:hypothetical protein BDZ45DRAFT_499221 [Acephala macrosclerotiorum]